MDGGQLTLIDLTVFVITHTSPKVYSLKLENTVKTSFNKRPGICVAVDL